MAYDIKEIKKTENHTHSNTAEVFTLCLLHSADNTQERKKIKAPIRPNSAA
jgi:hypothetical protein